MRVAVSRLLLAASLLASGCPGTIQDAQRDAFPNPERDGSTPVLPDIGAPSSVDGGAGGDEAGGVDGSTDASRGDADGGESEASTPAPCGGGTPSATARGLFDCDGRVDEVRFYPGCWAVANGTETREWLVEAKHGDCQVVGDFDSDRKADLVIIDQGQLTWDLVRSSGTGFLPPTRALEGWGCGAFHVVGDYNGDGRDDIAVVFRDPRSSAWTSHIALSTGTGTFTTVTAADISDETVVEACALELDGDAFDPGTPSVDTLVTVGRTSSRCVTWNDTRSAFEASPCEQTCTAFQWSGSLKREADTGNGRFMARTEPAVLKRVRRDMVLTSVAISVTGLALDWPVGGDAGVFFSKPGPPNGYPTSSTYFPSEVVFSHFERYATRSDWSWNHATALLFPARSRVKCGVAMWSAATPFDDSALGNVECTMTLEPYVGQNVRRALRFPYVDQRVPAVTDTAGVSGRSPAVRYRSTADFPLRARAASFFFSFPYDHDVSLSFCVRWLKGAEIHRSACIPTQSRSARGDHDGYAPKLALDWNLPPGDALSAQCTYRGSPGSQGDCVAYVEVDIPAGQVGSQSVYRETGMLTQGEVEAYCADNVALFTHPMFQTDGVTKCINALLRPEDVACQ